MTKIYMKIKFNAKDNLPFNKIFKLHNLVIIIRFVFQEDKKYYPQVFLDECLYELLILEYDRINLSDWTDLEKKTHASKQCDNCHYWYFLDMGFKFEQYSCYSCHDLMQKPLNFNDVAIVFVKGNDYRIHFWYMNKDNAINIKWNSNLK